VEFEEDQKRLREHEEQALPGMHEDSACHSWWWDAGSNRISRSAWVSAHMLDDHHDVPFLVTCVPDPRRRGDTLKVDIHIDNTGGEYLSQTALRENVRRAEQKIHSALSTLDRRARGPPAHIRLDEWSADRHKTPGYHSIMNGRFLANVYRMALQLIRRSRMHVMQ
jgi:hypothetical protein